MSRDVPTGWRVASFSALTRDVVEEPRDYDAVRADRAEEGGAPQGIFAFPRGARAGRCLHELMENISFDAGAGDIATVARQALAGHGFDAGYERALTEMAGNVLATALDQNRTVRLRDVTDAQRVCELEFYFPLARLTAAQLRDVLGDFTRGRPLEQRLEQLDFRIADGFMHGYIDLVFECAGRYYLADHKSNWLGNTLDDYVPAALEREIARHDYYLQYLIYSVALHRHLSRSLPDYDYERHFGGAYYLFLRGMHPDSGPDRGVYFDRPGRSLMQQLERLFCGAAP